jgi:hypothetical protein
LRTLAPLTQEGERNRNAATSLPKFPGHQALYWFKARQAAYWTGALSKADDAQWIFLASL